uniref:Uncharacterized protein n=1 Tax=Arundo donax TaxID=35708 RepID=A0A0A8ZH17_ARUDO
MKQDPLCWQRCPKILFSFRDGPTWSTFACPGSCLGGTLSKTSEHKARHQKLPICGGPHSMTSLPHLSTEIVATLLQSRYFFLHPFILSHTTTSRCFFSPAKVLDLGPELLERSSVPWIRSIRRSRWGLDYPRWSLLLGYNLMVNRFV